MAEHAQPSNKAAFSLPSILSIVCAVLSFSSGAALGFVAAIGAISFGLIGVLLAFLPHKRGGMISIISVFLGAVGIIAAIFKLVF